VNFQEGGKGEDRGVPHLWGVINICKKISIQVLGWKKSLPERKLMGKMRRKAEGQAGGLNHDENGKEEREKW